jgi:hypothetical protein
MEAQLKPIADIFRTNDHLFSKSSQMFNGETVLQRFDSDASHALWIMAHLTDTKVYIAGMFNLPIETPWTAKTFLGSNVSDFALQDLPSLDEVAQTWKEVTDAVLEHLPKLSAEALAADPGLRMPLPEPSLLGALTFAAYHEMYHLGQLSYILRLTGEPSLMTS